MLIWLVSAAGPALSPHSPQRRFHDKTVAALTQQLAEMQKERDAQAAQVVALQVRRRGGYSLGFGVRPGQDLEGTAKHDCGAAGLFIMVTEKCPTLSHQHYSRSTRGEKLYEEARMTSGTACHRTVGCVVAAAEVDARHAADPAGDGAGGSAGGGAAAEGPACAGELCAPVTWSVAGSACLALGTCSG